MFDSELQQLELVAAVDDLRRRVRDWIEAPSAWQPIQSSQGLLQRVMDRLDALQVRLEAPLVVATFGGTGVGKSSLVNALVGAEVTMAGRQRPTTERPVLIAHRDADLGPLDLPLTEVDVVYRDADLLRDIVLLDCPDPDTTDDDQQGGNLERLRTLLPYCDVLLYVSTQQKYRSARVAEELLSAAAGCRMIFVQTHADLDEDIRADWRSTLAPEFDVPDLFFVDARQALADHRSGRALSGEMARLIELLRQELSAASRIRVRRTNALDLLQAGLERAQSHVQPHREGLRELERALAEQRRRLSETMAARLQEELLSSHGLWERRLLAAVVERWGLSPFSCILRIYQGLGGILTSTAMFRARSSASVALLGAMQGARWLEGRRQEQAADATLQKASLLGLDEALLREAEIVFAGHCAAARIDRSAIGQRPLPELRKQAALVEEQFVGDAGRRVERLIQDLSQRNSRPGVRLLYELAFCAFLGFVLYRVGRNFFFDSFWRNEPLLSSDFYLAAALFLILWSGLLLLLFSRRLSRGLNAAIRLVSAQLVDLKLSEGLSPRLEEARLEAELQADELDVLLGKVIQLRRLVAADALGGRQLSQVESR